MNTQDKVISLIRQDLERIRLRNPLFSLRSYARLIDVSPATLSLILAGKARITRRIAEKVFRQVHLPSAESQLLLKKLKLRTSSELSAENETPDPFTPIDMDKFKEVANWTGYAVMSLAETVGFEGKSKWVAKRLGISTEEASDTLKRLTKLDLLFRDSDGKLRWTGKQFKTTSGIPNSYIRMHHLQGLELSRRAMEEDEFHACDFTSTTMAIALARLPEAKKLIWEFHKKLTRLLDSNENTEVYRVNVQLFPLSGRKAENAKP